MYRIVHIMPHVVRHLIGYPTGQLLPCYVRQTSALFFHHNGTWSISAKMVNMPCPMASLMGDPMACCSLRLFLHGAPHTACTTANGASHDTPQGVIHGASHGHFIRWITPCYLAWGIPWDILLAKCSPLDCPMGLQGVSTWTCLMAYPIEFHSDKNVVCCLIWHAPHGVYIGLRG